MNAHEYWDRLSVAAAEVRDAIDEDYSKEGLEALQKVFNDVLKEKIEW